MADNRHIEFTHRVTTDTHYYFHYAQQAPPDGTLRAGSKVRVVADEGSVRRVVTGGEMSNGEATLEPLQTHVGGFTHRLLKEEAYYGKIVAPQHSAGVLAAGSKLKLLSDEDDNPAHVEVTGEVSASNLEPL
jgi:hypothetical protein